MRAFLRVALVALVALVGLVAVGCSGDSDASADGVCPVTLANGSMRPEPLDTTWNHGNGELWTWFWPHGVVVATADFVQADGSVRMKWPWWRGVRGELKVEGRILDAAALPVRVEISDAYGRSGFGFQPTTIFFPSDGSWEVTGSVGEARLTFVTLVVKPV